MADLSLHPLVQRDLRQILEHYAIEGGDKLADKFFAEAEQMVERIRKDPEHLSLPGQRRREVESIAEGAF